MVDTAGTLCKAAEVIMDAGASEVHAYISHGVSQRWIINQLFAENPKNEK